MKASNLKAVVSPVMKPEPTVIFFEQLFGRAGFRPGDRGQYGFHARGQDSHAKIYIDLEDSFRGATRNISLSTPEMNAQGQVQVKHRSLNIKIQRHQGWSTYQTGRSG